MINNKRVLAIVPARGGSKRLPRKNILTIAGKPLIHWTIEAALNSKYIDEVLISTDDADIADVSSKYNISLPELRPSGLSTDQASTQDVILYTLQKFGGDFDIVVILQPTSPLRQSEHIDGAFELFIKNEAFSIVSVTPCEHPPIWSNTLPVDGSMGKFLNKDSNKRSQELDSYYRLNGAIYIYDVRKLISNGEMKYTNKTYAYKMCNRTSVDIDTQLDFDFASLLLNKATKY